MDRNQRKDCILNSLLTETCPNETREMQECTKKFGKLIKKEGKCIKEINKMINCVESNIININILMHN